MNEITITLPDLPLWGMLVAGYIAVFFVAFAIVARFRQPQFGYRLDAMDCFIIAFLWPPAFPLWVLWRTFGKVR